MTESARPPLPDARDAEAQTLAAKPFISLSDVPPQPTAGLSFGKKLGFATVFLIGVLVLAEIVLAMVGVKPITWTQDPWVEFEGSLPLFEQTRDNSGRDVMSTAPNKRRYFNAQSFPVSKAPGIRRIFCLGGSTTYGHPYNDRTSFAGWLREMLPVADPSQKWEVINAGGISYASYRIAALMEELIRYEPDIFIVYDGHNEFLEQRTYGTLREQHPVIRRATTVLSHTRTFSAARRVVDSLRREHRPNVLSAEVSTVLDNALDDSIGPESYHRDDDQRAFVVAHFRLNLHRMVEIARGAGAAIVFVTPACKLRDCEPFRSEHRSGLSPDELVEWEHAMATATAACAAENWRDALAACDQALARDDRHAHSHFQRARVLEKLGRIHEARTAYQRAIDEDVCPLRAPREIVTTVRDIAREFNVPLADSEASCAKRAPDGITGEPQFLDHVHPTIEENRILASELIDVFADTHLLTRADSWNDAAARGIQQRVESGLPRNDHGVALCTVAQVYNWAGRFAESGRLAERALEMIPDNAEAHFLAGYSAVRDGQLDPALRHYSEAVRLQPGHAVAQNNLGSLLLDRSEFDKAITCFEQAIRAEPDFAIAHNNLGRACAQYGDMTRAVVHIRKAILLRPDYAGAHENMGMLYAQQGQMTLAAAEFRESVRLSPSASAYSNLGSALANQGDVRSADEAFRNALELDPAYEHAQRGLARLKSVAR